MQRSSALVLLAALAACGDGADNTLVADAGDATPDAGDVIADAAPDAAPDAADTGADPDAAPALTFRAVTFNTGGSANGDGEDNAGFGSAQAEVSDTWYGNGLAWSTFVDDTARWFEQHPADIVAFQEIFDVGQCGDIPAEAHDGFVCETWTEGDETVPQRLLGDGWQIACHPGKPDKCIAIRRGFGTIRGCDTALCPDAARGEPIFGCGNGARVAAVTVDLSAGGELTVINVHGTSGFSPEDQGCRLRQIEHIFDGIGDSEPLASGQRHLILGDFNTDPARMLDGDASARLWREFVGSGLPFHWITPDDADAPGTYGGLFIIDHVVSDAVEGSCVAPPRDGDDAVMPWAFYDHRPWYCELTLEAE